MGRWKSIGKISVFWCWLPTSGIHSRSSLLPKRGFSCNLLQHSHREAGLKATSKNLDIRSSKEGISKVILSRWARRGTWLCNHGIYWWHKRGYRNFDYDGIWPAKGSKSCFFQLSNRRCQGHEVHIIHMVDSWAY